MGLKKLVVVFVVVACGPILLGQSTAPPYDRDAFGDWWDVDGDCLNTRHELLSEQSLVSVATSRDGCRVLSGLWLDAYTAARHSSPDRSVEDMHVDHLVPLSNAWHSGAWQWTDAQRREFFNWRPNLRLAQSFVNRDKSDSTPDEWMPRYGRCLYVATWDAVKSQWGLSMGTAERSALDAELFRCGLSQ